MSFNYTIWNILFDHFLTNFSCLFEVFSTMDYISPRCKTANVSRKRITCFKNYIWGQFPVETEFAFALFHYRVFNCSLDNVLLTSGRKEEREIKRRKEGNGGMCVCVLGGGVGKWLKEC